jgi:hypothetical protein
LSLFDLDYRHPPARPIIGLTGKKGVGKDTLAAELIKSFGYARVAQADPVKDLALEIDPRVGPHDEHDVSDARLSELHYELGWDKAKESTEVRRMLQAVGTGVRDVIGPDTWIDLAWRKIHAGTKPVVITDIRFENEAERVWDNGGIVVRITRTAPDSAAAEVDHHISETEMDDVTVDMTINNFDLATFLDWAPVVHRFALVGAE